MKFFLLFPLRRHGMMEVAWAEEKGRAEDAWVSRGGVEGAHVRMGVRQGRVRKGRVNERGGVWKVRTCGWVRGRGG